tara:strand:+ start:5228 stop:5965 length:738 start_codon:yes stop_codon:yes gene_type:complete
MALQFTLEAQERDKFGKRASRRYRAENLVPAEIYGEAEKNLSILVNSFQLDKQIKDTAFYSNVINLKIGDKSTEVILKGVQRDPTKSTITHIDFQIVRQDKKVNVSVPIKFIGEDDCVGIKMSGGKLSHTLTELQISCFPKDIPENIEVDVTNLDIGNSIHISEIKIPNDIELSTGDKEHDTAVVSCYMPKEEKIEEEVKPDETEAAAEGAEAEAEGEAKEGKTEAAKEEEQTDQKAEKSDSKKD